MKKILTSQNKKQTNTLKLKFNLFLLIKKLLVHWIYLLGLFLIFQKAKLVIITFYLIYKLMGFILFSLSFIYTFVN